MSSLQLVVVGLVLLGLSASAMAALYTPKKKVKWGDESAPKVKTLIQVRGDRNDCG